MSQTRIPGTIRRHRLLLRRWSAVGVAVALVTTVSACAPSESAREAVDRWAERAAAVVEPPLTAGPFIRATMNCESGGVAASTRFEVDVQSPRMETLVDDMKDAFRLHGWDDLVDKPVGILPGPEHDGRGVWLYPPIPRSDDAPSVFLDWDVATEILTVLAVSDCASRLRAWPPR